MKKSLVSPFLSMDLPSKQQSLKLMIPTVAFRLCGDFASIAAANFPLRADPPTPLREAQEAKAIKITSRHARIPLKIILCFVIDKL